MIPIICMSCGNQGAVEQVHADLACGDCGSDDLDMYFGDPFTAQQVTAAIPEGPRAFREHLKAPRPDGHGYTERDLGMFGDDEKQQSMYLDGAHGQEHFYNQENTGHTHGSDDDPLRSHAVLDPRMVKIREIAHGIVETNPGLHATEALRVATATVERFPRLITAAEDLVCDKCGAVFEDKGSKDAHVASEHPDSADAKDAAPKPPDDDKKLDEKPKIGDDKKGDTPPAFLDKDKSEEADKGDEKDEKKDEKAP